MVGAGPGSGGPVPGGRGRCECAGPVPTRRAQAPEDDLGRAHLEAQVGTVGHGQVGEVEYLGTRGLALLTIYLSTSLMDGCLRWVREQILFHYR